MSEITDAMGQESITGHSSETATDAPENRGEIVSEKLVPVGEAIRYRKRAQAAEQELEALKGRLQDAEVELEQTRQAAAKQERREKINELLADADAVDIGVARLLTESAVEMMEEPDIHAIIEDLRRQKPYLFKKGQREGAMMPAQVRERIGYRTEQAAERAAKSGSRRDLLRYLRLRREG